MNVYNHYAYVKNERGIHCRPSCDIVNLILEYEKKYEGMKIKLYSPKKEEGVLASSVLEILAMRMERGERIKISVSGKNPINILEDCALDIAKILEKEEKEILG